jgi:TPR repeat protein
MPTIQAKTYIRDYTYTSNSLDTRETSQIIALEQVKVLLLNELGTHIRHVITMKNESNGISSASEDIEALSAGTIKTVILEEDWNKPIYYIKAHLEADPDEIILSIKKLIDNSKISKILKEERKEKNSALRRIEKLSIELATATNKINLKKQYEEAVKSLSSIELYSRGKIARIKGQDSAIDMFRQAASLNNGNALYMLGEMYWYGDAGVIDNNISKSWFEKSLPSLTKEAEMNNVESQYNLGRLYSHQDTGFQSNKKSKYWLKKAIDNAHLDAHINLAWISPPSEAAILNKAARDLAYPLAKHNDIDACFILGELYLGVVGIVPNYIEAEKWLKCAAAQNDLTAVEFLADLYFGANGKAIDMQSIKKLKNLIKNNLQSNGYIYYLVGMMHMNGVGGADKNTRIAKIWLDLAKRNSIGDTFNKANSALQKLK